MDLQYLYSVYKLCVIDGLAYYDKYKNTYYNVEYLKIEDINHLSNILDIFINNQPQDNKLYRKLKKTIQNLKNGNCYLGSYWHTFTTHSQHQDITHVRVITSNAQIILDQDKSTVIDVLKPRHKISYSKFKKQYRNKQSLNKSLVYQPTRQNCDSCSYHYK